MGKIKEKPVFYNNVRAIMKDGDGNIIKIQEGHNTITNGDYTQSNIFNGLIMTLALLANDDDDGNLNVDPTSALTNMELGKGTPGNGGLQTPVSPSTDKAFNSKTWAYVGTLTNPKITFSTSWDSAYDAMSGITEVVLDNADGDTFAYKTFTPALSKTDEGTITIEWEIGISVTS